MVIYLDMCSLQRPLDDKSQVRVLLEAEAVVAIIALCESGQVQLLSSDALAYESARNTDPVRKAHALSTLAKCAAHVRISPEIETRASTLSAAGIKPLDSLHLACAIEAGADYLCTCDDRS